MKKVVLLLIAFALPVFSQSGVTALLSVPIGDLAKKDGSAPAIGGAERVGVGLGLQGGFRIYSSLGVSLEGFFLYNGQDHQATADLLQSGGASSVTASGGNFFNFPVLGTLSFYLPITSRSSVSIYAGMGVDYMMITDMKTDFGGAEVTSTYHTDPALALSVGGKIMFHPFFVGLGFMNLGNHHVTSTSSGPGGSGTADNDYEILLISLSAGVDF